MKKLSLLGLALGMSFVSTQMNALDLPDLKSLLNNLNGIAQEFTIEKALYETLAGDIAKAATVLNTKAQSRQTCFDLLNDKYTKAVNCLATAKNNRQNVIDEYTREKNNIQNQIDALKKSTDQEIADLHAAIDVLNNQITDLSTQLGTLQDLTQDNVNKALADLVAIKAAYQSMVSQRTLFLADVSDLSSKVDAFAYLANKNANDLAGLICKN